MYVTTFYSFKGGVGRTMALVNIAVELARKGRRVLAVDFDLEAPGLDTFDLGRPEEETPGIVDFVETFRRTDRAPDVRDFVFESSSAGGDGGRLWVMPSGTQGPDYAQRLARLDWGELYDRHDGFLLFEDLKAQWRQDLEADYVLIDSRTGYTDVGGICTRHLPDAVVLLFFPNQQNLRGLTRIVRDIRAESEPPRKKLIDLHHVLSNVPDLDDEDEILQGITADFRTELGFNREPLAIHRYPSLSLLKQAIFTRDRARSRLAREYRALTTEIIRLNPADREGALEYIRLDGDTPLRGLSESGDRRERHLQRIEKAHRTDGEVLLRLGQLRLREGDDTAAGLFDRSIEAGCRSPEAWRERARYRRFQLNDAAGASEDALEVFRSTEATFPDWMMVLPLLRPKDLKQLPAAQGVQESDTEQRILLASNMTRSKAGAAAAMALLEPLLTAGGLDEEALNRARVSAVLALMALGRFDDAATLCRASAPSVQEMSMDIAFNYGMARWGVEGDAPREILARVIELVSVEPDGPKANYEQCLAVAHWASGNSNAAEEALDKAAAAIRTERSSFSCWSYLTVPGPLFIRHLSEMRKLFAGDTKQKPRFLRGARESSTETN